MTEFDVGKLADELRQLVSEAEGLLRATAGSASESASEARERAEEALRSLRDRLASVEREMRGHARAVNDYVQDNPWKAIAVVGGLALIIGLIMGRK